MVGEIFEGQKRSLIELAGMEMEFVVLDVEDIAGLTPSPSRSRAFSASSLRNWASEMLLWVTRRWSPWWP